MPADGDFDAQYDLETLARAREIESDHGRLARAKDFALRKQEEMKRLAADVPGTPRGVNNAVKNSKMVR